jgi:predicted Fe-S protein YdhL (DUF1289 family)
MNENQKEKFISQCVALTPCPNPDNHQMNDDHSGCKICKLSIEELQMWERYTDEEREVICNEILDR